MLYNSLLDGKTLVNDEKHQFNISISMIEIYNEKLQDLLIPVSKRPQGGYKIRENPKLGIYVENIIKKDVQTY